MVPEIRTLLHDPDLFFSELQDGPINFIPPIIIVGIGAVFSAITSYLMMETMFSSFGTVFSSIDLPSDPVSLLTQAVQGMPMYFVKWAVIAGIIYFIAGFYSKEGSFDRALVATGYGMIPLVIQNAVSIFVTLYYRPVLGSVYASMAGAYDITQFSGSGSLFQGVFAGMQKGMEILKESAAFQQYSLIMLALNIIFWLSSAYFWIHGFRHVRGVTLKEAAVAVLIPVGGFLLLNIAMAVLFT